MFESRIRPANAGRDEVEFYFYYVVHEDLWKVIYVSRNGRGEDVWEVGSRGFLFILNS